MENVHHNLDYNSNFCSCEFMYYLPTTVIFFRYFWNVCLNPLMLKQPKVAWIFCQNLSSESMFGCIFEKVL